MGKNAFFTLILICILLLALQCQKSEVNSEKLPSVTCQSISNMLLKTKTSDGQDIYIDSKGKAYFEPRAAKAPFVLSGSGCLIGTHFFGTVAHTNPKTFNKEGLEKLLKQADMGSDTMFIKNLMQSILEKGLKSPDEEGAWQYHRVSSFIILPYAKKGVIQRDIENSPFKIPTDDCIETEIENENEVTDVALYTLKKALPKGIVGFSIDDIANNNDFEKFKEQKSKIFQVESWGYPIGIMVGATSEVFPEPVSGQVSKWPNANVGFLQTNLKTNQGASGSFVISNNKIIGLIVGTDPINPNNTICTPAYNLHEMYKEALK